MESHYNPGKNFDSVFFSELLTCFDQDDSILKESQNNAWMGINDYWEANGQYTYDGKNDLWGILNPGRDGEYFEYMRTEPDTFGNQKITVIEPCNYVSNIAFYRAVKEICGYDWQTINTYQQVSIKRAIALLAFSSSFWHASHTRLAGWMDEKTIWMMVYQAYATAVQNLDDKPII